MVFGGVMSCNTDKVLRGEDAHLECHKPERWLSQLPETVTEAKIPAVYSNLMTFWGGGRACIGCEFSQLEINVLSSTLVSKFDVKLTGKSVQWILAEVIYPTAERKWHPSLPMNIS